MLYRVMIVEDDPLIREGLSRIVFWEECGLELVGCAANGEQAFDLLETVEADICITDIKMPKMDGLSFMRTCASMKKKIKFVVLSGYNEFELVKEAARIGIENYLLKPVDKEELIQTLVTIVEKLDAEQSDTVAMREGIRIFRENLLYRWITGEIQYEELKERQAYLGFSLTHDYQVGILRTSSLQDVPDSCSNKLKKQLMKYMQEMLDHSRLGCGVVDMNGNLLMLFTDAERNQGEIDAAIKGLVRYVETDGNFRSSVAMGITVKSFGDVEKSYYSAKSLLEDYELCSTSNILWCQDIDYIKHRLPSDYNDKIARLTDMFNRSDSEEVWRLWEEVSKGMWDTPGIRMSALHTMGLVFLNRLMHSVKRFRPTTEYRIALLQHRISEIYKNEHPDVLADWMKKMIEGVFELSEETAKQYSKTITKVLGYLEKNYEKNICIKTVADVFELNQVYLGRLFRQETGNGFTEYLNLLRIKKAKDLLENTDIPIQKIAERVGYHNSNYFYTVFKKSEGMTPAAFRQEKGSSN